MTADEENKVKIRFKFRSGEEFEAEGSPSFIEKQRAEFLQLIGKESKSSSSSAASAPALYRRRQEASRAELSASLEAPSAAYTPARDLTDPSDARFTPPAFTPSAPSVTPPGLSAAENLRFHRQNVQEETSLWEQVARTEENLVFLRRKSRLLSPETAALLLIGAAKVLLKAENGYSALALSKALARSGYGGGRLDRVLAAETHRGAIRATGTKRSRAYLLSDEGFARAYVLAGKLAEEWQ